MAIQYRLGMRLTCVCLVLGIVQGVWAQEPADAEPAPPEAAPMSPGVAAIMATNPETPAEKVRAAKILAGLDRPDLAKQLLGQVLAADLDRSGLFALEQRFGAPFFVQMSVRPELAPEGEQLARAVLEAAKAVLQDSARLEELVSQLSAEDLESRLGAIEGLMEGGRVSIGVLIDALADPSRAEEREMVRTVLAQFGNAAAAPLLAALEGGDVELKTQAIRTLAGMGARQAVPFLLAPAVDPETDAELQTIAQRGLATFGRPIPDATVAAVMLVQEARDYLKGRNRFREDLDGNVTVWLWDAESGKPVSRTVSADEARMVFAARLARDAYRLTPGDPEVRLLYLTSLLERASQLAGLDNRLPIGAETAAGKAAAAGLEAVEDVLVYAMERGYTGAAIAAVRILGERGSVLGQLRSGSVRTPLIEAVRHDDPRLRFAALKAVVALEPTAPFVGSASVVDAVAHFATSRGERRALVAGPSTAESQRIAGHLAALGYVTDTARSGRELMDLALRSADYELVLVDEGLQQPTVDFLLQQLRHDNRTAHLPVGVWARQGRMPRAEHLVRRDPLATAFPRAHSQETVEWQVERVLSLADWKRLNAEQRLDRADQAMQWLADWSEGHPVFRLPKKIEAVYDALFVPELAAQATRILANTGTPDAQKALVELASRWTQPLPRRKAAVEAFCDNTAGHGILLTSSEILRQYDRYNASQDLDVPSREVLSVILDCLEAPARVRREAATPLAESDED